MYDSQLATSISAAEAKENARRETLL
eukprot:COSAG01_NODE_68114_length_265_cov_0.614458_1_plen_25_part_10